jgi:uncharacterized membrane protein
MRLSETIEISAPAEAVWDYLDEPENYLHFMHGITRWEVIGERKSGLGTRIRMLIRIGAAEVGGLIEVVEWKEGADIAWNSVRGLDQRGRWMIRPISEDRTKVTIRWAYGVAGAGIGGLIAERLASPTLAGHLRRSLQQLKRQIEHEQLRAEAARRRAEREAAAPSG